MKIKKKVKLANEAKNEKQKKTNYFYEQKIIIK